MAGHQTRGASVLSWWFAEAGWGEGPTPPPHPGQLLVPGLALSLRESDWLALSCALAVMCIGWIQRETVELPSFRQQRFDVETAVLEDCLRRSTGLQEQLDIGICETLEWL